MGNLVKSAAILTKSKGILIKNTASLVKSEGILIKSKGTPTLSPIILLILLILSKPFPVSSCKILQIDSLCSPFGLPLAVFLRFAPILSSCLKALANWFAAHALRANFVYRSLPLKPLPISAASARRAGALARRAGALARRAGALARRAGALARRAGALSRRAGALARRARALARRARALSRCAGALARCAGALARLGKCVTAFVRLEPRRKKSAGVLVKNTGILTKSAGVLAKDMLIPVKSAGILTKNTAILVKSKGTPTLSPVTLLILLILSKPFLLILSKRVLSFKN